MKHYGRFSWLQTRLGFVALLVALVWAKTIMVDLADFSLFSAATWMQYITILLNPIPVSLLMIGSALYFKSAKTFYPVAVIMYVINLLLLQLNAIYYREFSDFMSVSTMLGYDKVNQGLGASSISLVHISDVFIWIDLAIILGLFVFKKLKFDKVGIPKFTSFAVTTLSILSFLVLLTLGEIERPQLITRQFDSKLMVKYLGIEAYTVVDGIKTQGVNQLRKTAKKSDLQKVKEYVQEHYAPSNPEYAGLAKGKNVIMIHLESFQQFLIGLKINGKEVTPFLNSLYNSDSSISFDNFFNQVGQGKTSDAETLLETSTFGLPQGSLFAMQGSDQTFQAMPAILKQNEGYSSAVFHGNNASFWNRSSTYKNMGYQYFFDASYYDTSGAKATGYGLKDKLLFSDSIQYLERLQQPFYTKYITVTNHTPYSLDDEDKDSDFVTTDTGSATVDGYFETAHYLDQSIEEFYHYLKKSGLYNNSVIVFYGDHYGISNSENKYLAQVLGKDEDSWTDWDNTMLQRVPLIIDMPGYTKGYINHTYGGEVDVMPTLEHLLGITDTSKYLQLGQDLLSKAHKQLIAFRDKDWTTNKYSYVNSVLYKTDTGEAITTPNKKQREYIQDKQSKVNKQLSISDSVNQKDLLRFYTADGFKKVKASDYNYSNGLAKLENLENQLGVSSKSLWSKNGNQTTTDLYETDAPEKNDEKTNTSRIQQVNPDGGDTTDGGDDTPNP